MMLLSKYIYMKRINETKLRPSMQNEWYDELCEEVFAKAEKHLNNLEKLYLVKGIAGLKKASRLGEGIYVASILLDDGSINVPVNAGLTFDNKDGNYTPVASFALKCIAYVEDTGESDFSIETLDLATDLEERVSEVLDEILEREGL